MRHLYTVVCLVVLLSSAVLCAQIPAPPPKPGPEHQKLQMFVGNWTWDGEVKAGPMGPGGKITGTDRWESLGGFFVLRNVQGKGPAGEFKGVAVLGYDSAKKTYVVYGFVSDGASATGTATVNGNTWTINETGTAAGKPMQERCTLAFAAGNTSF